MKSNHFVAVSFRLLVVCGLLTTGNVGAQEEDLNRAIEDQNRRTKGMTSLASRFKNLISDYLPAGLVEEEEEQSAAPHPAAMDVAVKEVDVIQGESATEDAIAAAAKQAELDEQAYLGALRAATAKMKIAGAFPKTKQIMVGAKNLGVGDEIVIEYEQRRYRLEILDVTSSELKLRDQQSQLELKVAIGMSRALPPGMSRTPPPDLLPISRSNPDTTASAAP